MLSIIINIFKILILFGVTVFVHELGHYLVARMLGLQIDVFSIGFGPALLKRRHNGIVYKIGAIPFGGYVALPQMDPGGEEKSDRDGRRLPRIAAWKKIPVAFSGAAGNLILAFVLAYIIFHGGQAYAPEKTNIIGYVYTNSPAYEAGLRIGDEITGLRGADVSRPPMVITSWEQFLLESSMHERVELRVVDGEGEHRTVLCETEKFWGSRMIPGITPFTYCLVLNVRPNSSAREAGIQPRDRIVELNGQPLFSREHLVMLVGQYRDVTVPVVIERGGATMELQVTPKYDEEIGRALIGIEFNTLDVRRPAEQIKSHATMIFRILQKLATPRESKAASDSLGGPIAIFVIFWLSVQGSILVALSFTCFINVNLAVINLLPLPVLDGGHILFALIEIITRRPLHRRVADTLANIFAVLLITLFVLLSCRDVKRMVLPMFAGDEVPAAETNAPPVPQE